MESYSNLLIGHEVIVKNTAGSSDGKQLLNQILKGDIGSEPCSLG